MQGEWNAVRRGAVGVHGAAKFWRRGLTLRLAAVPEGREAHAKLRPFGTAAKRGHGAPQTQGFRLPINPSAVGVISPKPIALNAAARAGVGLAPYTTATPQGRSAHNSPWCRSMVSSCTSRISSAVPPAGAKAVMLASCAFPSRCFPHRRIAGLLRKLSTIQTGSPIGSATSRSPNDESTTMCTVWGLPLTPSL